MLTRQQRAEQWKLKHNALGLKVGDRVKLKGTIVTQSDWAGTGRVPEGTKGRVLSIKGRNLEIEWDGTYGYDTVQEYQLEKA